MINSINSLAPIPAEPEKTGAVTKASEGFGDLLSAMVEQVNESQIGGDRAIEQLQSGKAQHLHEVMIAAEQADISLRMAVQIRNKALTAYEEIMRMQI